MNNRIHRAIPLAAAVTVLLTACGGSSEPAATAPATDAAATNAAPPPADLAAAASEAATTLQATATTWSPEAMEDLLAPVALYPDPVLLQLLVASTNPQEVLDAGNWLIANPNLSGKPADQAAEKAGFTVPMRAVMQFPDVVDKLCLNMPWTEELGQAYVNDQQGVMDAIQRLRKQAQDVGNLKSSPQMKVATQKSAGQPDVITVAPPGNAVYVPQYDPQAVYAPQPQVVVNNNAPVAAVPATTTTTTTTTSDDDDDDGHSTGSLVATGLLAFGAGMLVNEVFDDDDDYWHGGYYGGMYGGGMPYYPPYPYRPAYGGGFYPGSAYNRPNNYVRGGNTVIVNQNNNYGNRYDGNNRGNTRNNPRSPITAANPKRNDLQGLNAKAAQGPARKAPTSSDAWKGKGGYAGNNPAVRKEIDNQAAKGQRAQDARSREAAKGSYAGASNRPAAGGATQRPTPSAGGGKAAAPKVQGGYAGARPDRPSPANAGTREAARPANAASANRPAGDRGRAEPSARPQPAAQNRPQAAPQNRPQPAAQNRPAPQATPQRQSAMSQSSGGGREARAASSRGKQSMSGGARSNGGKRK